MLAVLDSYNTITAGDLKQRLDAGEQIHLIDVREDDEVAHGMIPGAIHIPLGQIPYRLDELPADEEVIYICRSGSRSDNVCRYVSTYGHTGATNLLGGMIAWVQLE